MEHRQLDYYEVMDRKDEIQFKKEIILLLDDLRLPPNIAGIFRLCDGLQVQKVFLLCNDEFVYSKKFKSIARVNEEHLDYEIIYEKEAIDQIRNYKQKGFHVSALEFTDSSDLLPKLVKSEKHFIIAGAEKYGIRPSFLKEIDQSVHIPMQGSISSLNVMQAVSIAVYEIRRREIL